MEEFEAHAVANRTDVETELVLRRAVTRTIYALIVFTLAVSTASIMAGIAFRLPIVVELGTAGVAVGGLFGALYGIHRSRNREHPAPGVHNAAASMPEDNLAIERATFERVLPELLRYHRGKWAMVKGQAVLGTYTSWNAAQADALDRFADSTPVLIKRIQQEDE